MSSRVQTALVKQLNRQLKIAEKKENQRLHRELRYRVRKIKLVNDHFDEQRDEISISFENYREQIVDAIAINRMRFELCINQKLEDIVDHDYVINHDEIVEDVDEVAERAYSVQNSLLFFGSLYPTKNTNSHNNDFYWFSFAVLVYMCSILY
jgi:two-component sensor histidine kinase